VSQYSWFIVPTLSWLTRSRCPYSRFFLQQILSTPSHRGGRTTKKSHFCRIDSLGSLGRTAVSSSPPHAHSSIQIICIKLSALPIPMEIICTEKNLWLKLRGDQMGGHCGGAIPDLELRGASWYGRVQRPICAAWETRRLALIIVCMGMGSAQSVGASLRLLLALTLFYFGYTSYPS